MVGGYAYLINSTTLISDVESLLSGNSLKVPRLSIFNIIFFEGGAFVSWLINLVSPDTFYWGLELPAVGWYRITDQVKHGKIVMSTK